jgi:uncharacterized 2Fe-2S/4Fe-4S cluster protein (DUF4445 family)
MDFQENIMKKCSVTVLPEAKTQKFDTDAILVDALLEMDVFLKTPCGGKGICGKCKVKAKGAFSDRTEHERHLLGDKGDYRLACQTRLKGDAEVFIDAKSLLAQRSYPKIKTDRDYAIALDIGTTTVQVSLVDISDDRSYLLNTFFNPQRRFGHDVITRISAASDTKNFKSLIRLLQEEIFLSVIQALEALAIPHERIKKIIVSGNTTMLHLFFGFDVSSIGVYPYKPLHIDFNGLSATDAGARMFRHAQVRALPALSGFLGGDLLGGLGLCYEQGFTKNTFFIDLGTNGEIFLINKAGEIYATSCAMGPALEGMNIVCGMTADSGAITHVWEENRQLRYDMIKDGGPVGITGTALIDIIAVLLGLGIITSDGAFIKETKNLPSPAAFDAKGHVRQINLWKDIVLTQKDIRSVQLAKGASLAASNILLKKAGCSLEDIEDVIIAGALGKHVDLDNFKKLKFIPDFPNAKYHVLGNTSIQAAERSCVDSGFLDRVTLLRNKVTEVELSMDPGFNEEFIASLNF